MSPLMKMTAAAALAAGMALAQAPATQTQPDQTVQPRKMMKMGRRGAFRQRLLQNLNLTDAQKQQAKSIFQQARQTAKPVRDQLKQQRQALSQAVKADNTAQINQVAASVGNLEGQLTAIRAGARAQFYGILTPEQKTQVDQMQQHVRQMFQQRRAAQRKNG